MFAYLCKRENGKLPYFAVDRTPVGNFVKEGASDASRYTYKRVYWSVFGFTIFFLFAWFFCGWVLLVVGGMDAARLCSHEKIKFQSNSGAPQFINQLPWFLWEAHSIQNQARNICRTNLLTGVSCVKC